MSRANDYFIFALLAIAMLALATCGYPVYADAPATVVPTSPVVKILIGSAFCSGSYIGDGLVITAGHCFWEIGRPADFQVQPDQGPSIHAVPMLASDTDVSGAGDYMVLSLEGAPDGWVGDTLDCHYTPALGDEVYALGFPGTVGAGPILTKGYVNGTTRTLPPEDEVGGPVFLADMPVAPGHSGSPVYHDGKVVGIAIAEVTAQKSWTAIQSVTDICFLLHLA